MKHAMQARDPVCGMMVDIDDMALQSTVNGTTYYFCATECRRRFDAAPRDFVDVSRAEPTFTEKWGVVAPKFGNAGSGGAELEPGPRAARPPR